MGKKTEKLRLQSKALKVNAKLNEREAQGICFC